MSFSHLLSEISALGMDIGFKHTELGTGTGSVQEIISSPKLIEGINQFVIEPANPNPFEGPVRDAVLGSVNDLRPDQLRAPTDLGFVDRFGDTFDNFSITGRWFRNTLNRGQLATDGASHNIGVEVTLPGSDLEYARINYSNQIYWPLGFARNWVIGLQTNLGYGFGYGEQRDAFLQQLFCRWSDSGGGRVRGFEENSLGPNSTAGARYLTEGPITLLRDDQGNIITDIAGNASFARDFGYQTEPPLDFAGNQNWMRTEIL